LQDALGVHRILLERDVAHEVVRLPRPVQTADELPDVLGLPSASCAVVRCYVAGDLGDPRVPTVLHAVVVPAGAHPPAAALSAALATPAVREATPAEINAATDCAARLVTAVALPVEVPVLVDAALDTSGTIYTATGESGTALAFRGADLPAVTGGRVVDLTRATPPPVIDLDAPRPAPATAGRSAGGPVPGAPQRLLGA
jgi:Cys-tRNA(Pro)/Cys-tRNA(Cys) deacylase